MLQLSPVKLSDEGQVLLLRVWVVDSYDVQVSLDFANLDGLRAYLCPDATSAQVTKSLKVLDAIVSERWSP